MPTLDRRATFYAGLSIFNIKLMMYDSIGIGLAVRVNRPTDLIGLQRINYTVS